MKKLLFLAVFFSGVSMSLTAADVRQNITPSDVDITRTDVALYVDKHNLDFTTESAQILIGLIEGERQQIASLHNQFRNTSSRAARWWINRKYQKCHNRIMLGIGFFREWATIDNEGLVYCILIANRMPVYAAACGVPLSIVSNVYAGVSQSAAGVNLPVAQVAHADELNPAWSV